MKNGSKERGITLIALVITIIILMILVGISINLVFGQNGIIVRAKWSAYVTEYGAVDEQKELYAGNYLVNKIGKKKVVTEAYEIASLSSIVKTTDEKILMYPVSEKVNIEDMYISLKETIKKLENLNDNDLQNEDLVNLYQVDFSKINANAKKNYVINIVSGMLYSVEYERYGGELYHTPKLGIENIGYINNEKITETGTYEIIVDAGQIVSWDSIEIQYNKYVENSLSLKVYTSDDEINWKEDTIELGQNTEKKYNILTADRTRYLKAEVIIEDVNGENSEVDYILVNFYNYRETNVTPKVTTDAAESNGIYTVPTSSNGQTEATGTATITQKITVPTDAEKFMLNVEEFYGNPSTTVTITNTDGTTENYTVLDAEELKKVTIKPGATVVVTTTLNAGDGIGKVELLAKESDVSNEKKTTASPKVSSQDWKTAQQRRYVYNNGGSGYWEKCLVNDVEVDETGIIIESEDAVKRIKVRYQVSEDGSSWSEYFSNIEEAENTQYLRVVVDYQVKGDIEYGDTSNNKIKVILNDGSWVATFLDEDGTDLFKKSVYFENSNKQATLTLPSRDTNKEDKVFVGWKIENEGYDSGTTYTLTENVEFTAIYINLNIYTVEDLVEFRDIVNMGITFKGLTINLLNDLDLSSVCGENIENWTPIGDYATNAEFKGTFEGNYHKILNIYMNVTTNTQSNYGLFGVSSGNIKNVNLENGSIIIQNTSGTSCGIGSLVGNSTGKIEGCRSNVSIIATGNATGGGIVGIINDNTAQVNNCKNFGIIQMTQGSIAGGVIGFGYNGTITNCENQGKIILKSGIQWGGTGGIIGRLNQGEIDGCVNYSSIQNLSTEDARSGGIVGSTGEGGSVTINNSYNKGSIEATGKSADAGGILGHEDMASSTNINNCYNIGTITASRYIGGISGYSGTIKNCYSTVSISSEYLLTLSQMKESSFVEKLGDAYSIDINNKNDGLAILKWQL